MKKLSAVVLSLMLCVSVSFAARGGTNSSSSSSSNSSSSSSSSSNGSFGLGYSKFQVDTGGQFVGVVTFDQIAGRYWFNDDLGIDIKLGFGSGDTNTRMLVGANIIGNFIKVNKLNVYWLAGLDFGNYKLKNAGPFGGDVDCSVFVVQGGVGAEYFVVPCLSVLTEMGIRYISVKPDGGNSMSDFGVFADWLPQAGVRFYF